MKTKVSTIHKKVKKHSAEEAVPKKKKVVKKVVAKPVAKKKVVTKKKVKSEAGPKPIKHMMNKSQLINHYVDRLNELAPEDGWERKHVVLFLGIQEEAMLASVTTRGAGMFMQPGLFKVVTRSIPARKAGVMVRNPATGDMVKGKAKPASVRVKIRPLAKLKAAAIG